MRKAFNDVGWLVTEATTPEGAVVEKVYGFSLGYDFAAEHEHGASFIKGQMGIPTPGIPIGVEGRTMTQVPTALRFMEYACGSADRRIKKTAPAAILTCSSSIAWAEEDRVNTGAKLAEFTGSSFTVDMFKDKRWYKPGRDDIVSAWSSHSGFAINVRGEENVRRLKELHQAFLDKKVSLADATIMGFVRKALSFVMNERLPEETFTKVREQDEAYMRLVQAGKNTGIEEALKAANLSCYALSPRWRTGEGSDLYFWLNPANQREYSSGWFNASELRQWIEGKGPVVDTLKLRDRLDAEISDWSFHLVGAVNEMGLGLNRSGLLTWIDKESDQIGLILDFSNDKAPEGLTPVFGNVYAWDKVKPIIEAKKAAYEAAKASKAANELTSA